MNAINRAFSDASFVQRLNQPPLNVAVLAASTQCMRKMCPPLIETFIPAIVKIDGRLTVTGFSYAFFVLLRASEYDREIEQQCVGILGFLAQPYLD